MSFRILVTGSRHWSDEVAVEKALVGFNDKYGDGSVPIVVHGAADGLDVLAASVAERLGWGVDPYPVKWVRVNGRLVNPEDGPRRNQRMVDVGANLCIAFPMEGSKGTWDCARRADKAGIRVVVVKSESRP